MGGVASVCDSNIGHLEEDGNSSLDHSEVQTEIKDPLSSNLDQLPFEKGMSSIQIRKVIGYLEGDGNSSLDHSEVQTEIKDPLSSNLGRPPFEKGMSAVQIRKVIEFYTWEITPSRCETKYSTEIVSTEPFVPGRLALIRCLKSHRAQRSISLGEITIAAAICELKLEDKLRAEYSVEIDGTIKRFDFHLAVEPPVLIEYHGPQHFEERAFYKMDRTPNQNSAKQTRKFNAYRNTDRIKFRWAREAGYRLIYIDHRFKNIYTIKDFLHQVLASDQAVTFSHPEWFSYLNDTDE